MNKLSGLTVQISIFRFLVQIWPFYVNYWYIRKKFKWPHLGPKIEILKSEQRDYHVTLIHVLYNSIIIYCQVIKNKAPGKVFLIPTVLTLVVSIIYRL